MKLRYRLWLTFSLLWLIGLAAVHLFIVNIYQNRAYDNQRELAFSQGVTITERITGLFPRYAERAEGYLDYYGSLFSTRLFLLDANKQLSYDSFDQFAMGSHLTLAILSTDQRLPVSIFLATKAYGTVQYTLLEMNNPSQNGYLLMVKDSRSVSDDIVKFRDQMLGFLAAATAVGFLVFYAVSIWFTRPIRRIALDLQRITPRNRVFPFVYRRKDEIGHLVAQIKLMIRQLDTYEKQQRRFISTSSHQLKTPLATMQLIIENLPSLEDDKKLRQEYTEDLQKQIDKMKQTVQGMLDVYRLADQPLRKRQIPFAEIQLHVIEEFQHLADSKQIRLVYEEKKPSLYADAAMFLMGLDNLVSNAIRYSPENSEIKLSLQSAGPGRTKCSLCDQGMGIDAEDIPYIFEPFYRSRTAVTWDQEGSGLGLAIVKQMVDLHEGEIHVESITGQGSCFQLLFPDTD
ncbi:MAG: HAMP domain-containing histidine kinase [Gorillibacterium sp.]|nr:HAMP domain-containing histidine kinase [Gorillibacterium sp.]